MIIALANKENASINKVNNTYYQTFPNAQYPVLFGKRTFLPGIATAYSSILNRP